MHAATSEECTANVALTASQLDRPSAGDNKTNSRALPSLQLLEADGPLLPAFNSSGSTTSRQSVLELDAVAVAGRTSSVYSLVSAAATPMARVCNSSSCSAQQQAAAAAEAADVCDDEQPLLHHHCASYSSVSSVQDSCTAGSRELRSIHDSSVGLIGRAWHVCSSCRDAVTDWWAYSSQPEQRAAIARTFLIGSAAGTASGIMSGMTGRLACYVVWLLSNTHRYTCLLPLMPSALVPQHVRRRQPVLNVHSTSTWHCLCWCTPGVQTAAAGLA